MVLELLFRNPRRRGMGRNWKKNGGDGGLMEHSNRALVNLNDIKAIVGNMGSRFIMLNDEDKVVDPEAIHGKLPKIMMK